MNMETHTLVDLNTCVLQRFCHGCDFAESPTTLEDARDQFKLVTGTGWHVAVAHDAAIGDDLPSLRVKLTSLAMSFDHSDLSSVLRHHVRNHQGIDAKGRAEFKFNTKFLFLIDLDHTQQHHGSSRFLKGIKSPLLFSILQPNPVSDHHLATPSSTNRNVCFWCRKDLLRSTKPPCC